MHLHEKELCLQRWDVNCTLFLYYNGIHVVLLGLYNSQVTKSSYTLYRHKI